MIIGCVQCGRTSAATGFGAVQCQPMSNDTNFICPPGSGTKKVYSGCYRCSASKVSNGTSNICTKCPPNSVPNSESTGCRSFCPPGKGYFNGEYVNDDLVNQASVCNLCPAGTYNPGSFWRCQTCGSSYFSTLGSTACQRCIYPFISDTIGGKYRSCDDDDAPLSMSATPLQLSALIIFTGLAYVSALSFLYLSNGTNNKDTGINIYNKTPHTPWTWKNILGLVVITILPLLDAMTDGFFVFSSMMRNVYFFIFSGLFPLGQLLLFLRHIYVIGATPRLPIPIPRALIFFENHNIFSKFVITTMISTPWLVINSLFLISWLFVGWVLYICKLMSVGKIEQVWLYIWTGRRYRNLPKLNQEFANWTVLGKILFESIPQLLIQTINNSLLSNWTIVNKVSAACSILSILNGLYRLLFSKLFGSGDLLGAPIIIRIFDFELLVIEEQHCDISEIYQYEDSNKEGVVDVRAGHRMEKNLHTSPHSSSSGGGGVGVEVNHENEKKEWTTSPLSAKASKTLQQQQQQQK